MFRHHAATNNELASQSPPPANSAPSDPDILTTLAQFDNQQRTQLEQFKHKQAAERQREIYRQNQMSTTLAEDTPTPPRQSPPGSIQESPTHIIAQPKPTVPLPQKNHTSSPPTPPPASAVIAPESHSKNATVAASPQAAPQRSVGNSTSQGGNLAPSPAASRLPTPPPSAPQHTPNSIPTGGSQNSTLSSSLAQPSGVASAQTYERHGMTTGQKVLLAGGLLSSLFVLGYFVRWWQKRRRNQLNGPRKVDKLNIKGPFQKSEENLADADSEPIFGGPGHASISFDRLQVLSEKPIPFPRSDIYNQHSLPSPPPKSPSAARSSLTLEPPPPQPNILPNLKLISPLSQFNDQTPMDYRCKGPQMKGKIFTVERTYQAALADELVLHVGDRIEVAFYYDDGWCLGQNLDIGRYDPGQLSKGVFPRDCVGSHPIELKNESEGSSNAAERGLASDRTTYDDAEEQSRKAFRAISSNPSLSPLSSSIFEKFPLPPRSQDRLEAQHHDRLETQQRVSSLFIGRNAQLFLELDDALGEPESPLHVHFANPHNYPK
ncbi:hypothetical protein PGTUg99_026577 [Puccinia graminis f. sp. tritici]|uniref:SH3 domain-containing protein n=1 Tax=Puccinia graminis f. sp. tritici TaxID=56615 RepID=A0A5B0RG32_PUCGR|nr:hypothetical protein PGTUg99_026577 [Puccinia graminis f. sp. tritici]